MRLDIIEKAVENLEGYKLVVNIFSYCGFMLSYDW